MKINTDDLAKTIETAHQTLWRRMVDKKTGILRDYADRDGDVEIPTPEDCRECAPNALSWWSPIENGAFFNGLYLDALCGKWGLDQSSETKVEIKKVVGGLRLLQDVGKSEGFIARGVADDGASHFPLGSSDQTFPWFYGLWRYLRTDIPDEEERRDIVKRMDTVVRKARSLGWRMPAEEPFSVAGDWNEENFRELSRKLFASRAMFELTGDELWREDHEEMLASTVADGRNLLDFLVEDSADVPFHYTWINAASVAACREMRGLELDERRRDSYRECVARAARSAAEHVKHSLEFVNDPSKPNLDWRCMTTVHRPQQTVDEAVAVAREQIPIWNAACPAVSNEKRNVMYPLFAAWIVTLADDEALIEATLPDIKRALAHYQWEHLCYSAFFAAENVYYELKKRHMM